MAAMSAAESTGHDGRDTRTRTVDAALHARAKALFSEAVELDRGARDALLARVGGSDPALRTEVESLLEHHVPATLMVSRDELPAPAASRPPAAADGPLPVLHKRARTIVPMRRRVRLAALLLLVALPLAVVLWVAHDVQVSLTEQLASQLVARRDGSVRALTVWMSGEESLVREWAEDPRVTALSESLAGIAQQAVTQQAVTQQAVTQQGEDAQAALGAAPEGAALRELLAPVARRGGHRAFALLDPDGMLLARSPVEQGVSTLTVGMKVREGARNELARLFDGRTWMRQPFRLGAFHDAYTGPDREAIMASIAPVTAGDGTVVAALAFLLEANADFGSLLASAQVGRTGETYVFDREGNLLSESRFTDQLAAAGLLPDASGATPSLHLPLRDPGADLTAGGRAVGPRESWPLTVMAASAVAGHDGVNVDGYRDYRGVKVVGAWAWLEEAGFGVATEEDYAVAYAALDSARVAPLVLAGLFALTFVALALALRLVLRLQRDVTAARELGQYTLVELLGEGGTGQVWRARHALLARPAAVKVLRPDALGRHALERFELEMQVTARLDHPNTVEIYDSGRTEDGQFYYAMECLDGLSLQRFARAHGAQSPARVVHLLRQVCASLAEAHAAGLVHRDVKPGNIMLCRRAGELDVIKVLDFGLVKDLAAPAAEATAMNGLAGTPGYMSPERLKPGAEVNARCDVWAVGAVAFRLLTGRDLWSGSLAEILAQIVTQEPPRVSAFAPGPLPAGLDELVADCLQRDPALRPADAVVLGARLAALDIASWTQDDARAWWAQHDPSTRGATPRGGTARGGTARGG